MGHEMRHILCLSFVPGRGGLPEVDLGLDWFCLVLVYLGSEFCIATMCIPDSGKGMGNV